MTRNNLRKSLSLLTGPIGLGLIVAAWPMQGWATSSVQPTTIHEGKPASPSPPPQRNTPPEIHPGHANFLGETPSPEARRVANWAVSSSDNGGLPFVVIDKISAKLFVFDAKGLLHGATMALLGSAYGDDSTPGIGTRKLADIRPEERTTPAGRFVAALGRDLKHDILWVDYDAAISLHRVVTGNPGDRRRQRLASASALDKRISYGCINVPAKFYDSVVLKVFTGTNGIVYILPERRKLEDIFPLTAPTPTAKR